MQFRLAIFAFFAAGLTARTYPVDGIVVALDAAARTMLVSHRPIAKYMGAMLMPFRVEDPRELGPLHPGSHILFDLVVARDRSLARNIRPSGAPDAPIPPPRNALRIGDALPDFHLTDQLSRAVTLADLRGKVMAIDFIYTRCPLPDVCPRLSAGFAMLQRRFAAQLGTQLVLLSVTVDPDYDTPPVLAEYARRWAALPQGWRFLTGDIGPLAAPLGQVYWTDEGSIGHNAVTAVIDRNGRLAASIDGSSYRTDQLAHLIALELEKKP